MAKVSGKEVAEAILSKLEKEIKEKNLKPGLAIILAGNDPSSRIYVRNKIKAADRVGVKANLYEFKEEELDKCIELLKGLNKDSNVHGVIIQHPVYTSWNYDELLSHLDPQKDVDGFLENSPYSGATAIAVWEMLTAFSFLEGFKTTESFLKEKKIAVLGRGRAAGGPIIKLLEEKGFYPEVIVRDTENPALKIKKADIVIGATGAKNILNKSNIKKGAYVVGVGLGKEIIEGKERIYGDINEEEVSKIAKFYNPNLGGIGPLTIVSLLENVLKSAQKASE
ncbi:hypothetical protein A3C59_02235 [Candidatus Daviesbacteria bacterium RIFCSPHIGHO2_02_FULL_36_13]|uniref:Bifunctional protein FolD n=1 Tax=Candidatus Daviesbacteria bacterium RIFCSPHIGHO2_02_FULL_36_13 TaxID=1797768 RepID=A0A1F5JS57_9BACT|nr:MAG: hypothetical protein A3C59_02235 [Candidatus Daviesbacteria bacterium RIFCSPHIGHO2_02_FULL_36_13]OGE43061.1 MAG: hypothetical protein A3A45_02680 [Candidatus Daviesbacteria bacterium RIFCSPLOWO2_01_FULL_36_8]